MKQQSRFSALSKWTSSLSIGLLAVCLLQGCSDKNNGAKMDLAAQAALNYRQGMDDLIDGNYTEAMNAFRKVAKAPRYVSWSALAKIRIGDSLYFSGKFQEASQQYEAFLLQHKGDPNEPYVQMSLARSYLEQIPSDMWILPPPYEREREALNRSRNELERFLEFYAQDRHHEEAKTLLTGVKDMQFAFLNYVADYYEKREEFGGVIVRCESALSSFPERAREAKMDLRLAKAYLNKDRIADALTLYQAHLAAGPMAEDEAMVREWVEKLTHILESKKSVDEGSEPKETVEDPALLPSGPN